MRRAIAVLAAGSLLAAMCSLTAASAQASSVPWTWTSVSAGGVLGSHATAVTATCPDGYTAIVGGWTDSGQDAFRNESYSATSYTAHFAQNFSGTTTVSLWCAKSSQASVKTEHRTVILNDDGDGIGDNLADLACDSGETPVSADAAVDQVTASGIESTGGTLKWFLWMYGDSNQHVDVALRCVSTSDLGGWTFASNKVTSGSDDATLSTLASCPAGSRILTGGVHVDSKRPEETSSISEDYDTWSASVEDVPKGDSLWVNLVCVPSGDPTATITGGPTLTNQTSATFTFTGSDPADVGWSNWCFADTNFFGTCSGSWTLTDLTQGQHVFSVETVTPDNRGGASTEKDRFFYVDLTSPTISLATPPRYTLGSSVTFTSAGADDHQFSHNVVSITSQPFDGSTASDVNVSTSAKAKVATVPGTTYIATAQAFDAAGNESDSTAAVATAVPLDDLSLKASRHWQVVRGSHYYRRVVSRTTTKGATLSKKVVADRLALVATTCRTCGVVGVYDGSHRVARIDLHSSKTHYQKLLQVPTALSSHPVNTKVTIKVLSRGKRVDIDGLGVFAS